MRAPFVALAAFVSLASAQFWKDCHSFTLPNITGGYTQRTFIDFSTAPAGQSATDFLAENGLVIADTSVDDPTGISRTFVPGNVGLEDGALTLKVSAYFGSGNVLGAQVSTAKEIKFGSVRTVQKSSKVPGVREGNFFYRNDNAEIDMAILTSTTLEKKYRVDWSPEATYFYIDGEYQGHINDNVPTVDGHWMWNAWSNGDPCWSAGPPTSDSVTSIRSIDIVTGRTEKPEGVNICPI